MLAGAIEVRRRQGWRPSPTWFAPNKGKERGNQCAPFSTPWMTKSAGFSTSAPWPPPRRFAHALDAGPGQRIASASTDMAGASIERQIQERHQAEKVLASQARLIDLSQDAIITADGNRVITGWNSGAQEMYGWTEKEAVGQTTA